jgi:putative component of membrane protein insertase Oxa1/YidC/SpoIIIJ protein YidD
MFLGEHDMWMNMVHLLHVHNFRHFILKCFPRLDFLSGCHYFPACSYFLLRIYYYFFNSLLST